MIKLYSRDSSNFLENQLSDMSIVMMLSIAIIGCSIVNSWINNRRQIAFNRIDTIYDKIEVYIIKNDIEINSSMSSLLKSMKAIKINNELADIHILLVARQNIPKREFENNKKEYEKFIADLPEGLIALKKEFDHNVNKAIALSIFRVEFLIFFIFLVIKNMIKSKISVLFRMILDLFKYENIVVSRFSESGYKMAA